MDQNNISSKNFSNDEKTVNIFDVFLYLLSQWKWFLVSLFIFGNYYGCQWAKTPFTYRQAITIMVKTPENTQATMRLNRYNSFINPINVSNEILQFQSKELMRSVIDNLDANISYVIKNKLRPFELYTKSPVKVSFPDAKIEDYLSLTITPLNDTEVEISGFAGMEDKEKIKANLNDTIITPGGSLVVSPSIYFHNSWYGSPIKVTRYPRESMVGRFLANMNIRQMEENAAMLQISLTDQSAFRAADVLNMLVSVYNEEAIAEKNRTAVTVGEFINLRLASIQEELGDVETKVEELRKDNSGMEIGEAAAMYTADSRTYRQKVKELDNSIRLAKFMQNYLQDEGSTDLIQDNTGLVDMNIEGQIGQYNAA
ncbi:MAG: chromosome partitioning protein ParA, partial [Tannerella sp.]|nr:chromosome partitioning protein ParA [Tannerella sp.]